MTDPVMLLSQAHGEGRVTFRALRAAGFYTLAEIASANAQVLADRAHLSAGTARRLKTGAEEMIGRGIGDEQPAPDGRRPARSRQTRQFAPSPFSEGVSNDEALLLGQGSETPPPVPAAPDTAAAQRAIDMAAAAQAAAALPRAGSSASVPAAHDAVRPEPAAGERDRTFWKFG